MNKRVWSTEQSAIIEHRKAGKPNLAVRARAGTGKSTVGEGLIDAANVPRMLYLQFNKRNQVEMSARITNQRCVVSTFHSAQQSSRRVLLPILLQPCPP